MNAMSGWQILVVVLLLVGLSEARFQLWSFETPDDQVPDPDFCRGAPCPPFEVVSKGSTYELREYSKSKHLICSRSAAQIKKKVI